MLCLQAQPAYMYPQSYPAVTSAALLHVIKSAEMATKKDVRDVVANLYELAWCTCTCALQSEKCSDVLDTKGGEAKLRGD